MRVASDAVWTVLEERGGGIVRAFRREIEEFDRIVVQAHAVGDHATAVRCAEEIERLYEDLEEVLS